MKGREGYYDEHASCISNDHVKIWTYAACSVYTCLFAQLFINTKEKHSRCNRQDSMIPGKHHNSALQAVYLTTNLQQQQAAQATVTV